MHPQVVLDYYRRVGAEVLNFRRAMIKRHYGNYYVERAIIKIHDDGSVVCSVKEFAPTEEEAAAMKAALAKVDWPKIIRARNTRDLKLTGDLYEFIDRRTNEVIMVQQRPVGKKAYIPWVMLSDGKWSAMEPEGGLPFWKPPVRDGESGRIMIHEGAKAAAFVDRKLQEGAWDHPWAEELRGWQHWGLIGGALAPHRADYDELAAERPSAVCYVCDNDKPGVSALQKVSKAWGRSLKGIMFGDAFPSGWDLAEKMPPTMFTKKGRFIGPDFQALIQPATFATELVPPADGKGRPKAEIRSDFVEEWLHCVTPEVFLHKDWPNKIYSAKEFNNKISPFSHVQETAPLLMGQLSSKSMVLKYRPDLDPGIFGGADGGMFVNTHAPSRYKAEKGDATPWTDFMEHLVVDDDDRIEMYRWIATLLVRPDLRPHYAVLAISEQQGVGKGTLGEKILAPLVGDSNVSFPSEKDIVDSSFNYWLPHKRLAVVHEIYAGHSSKAYNELKSAVTDSHVTVNQKFQSVYAIENYIMIYANSNSTRALQLAVDDRRWFVPKITDKKRSNTYWETFNIWLKEEGGLQIILWWCKEWLRDNAPALNGSDAPMSATKRIMVSDGYSPGQALVNQALIAMRGKIDAGELAPDSFLLDCDLVSLIRDQIWNGSPSDKVERPATVRSVAKANGMFVGGIQCQIKAWGPKTFGARVLSFDEETAAKAPSELGGEKLAENERRLPLDPASLVGF